MTERQHLVSRVKALAEALEGSEVGELDITEQGTRILIRRRLDPIIVDAAPAPTVSVARSARPRRHSQDALAPAASAPAPDPGVAIVAPLTGVFYSAPSPSSAPFVAVGDTVQAGQVVCIVEAMKVFNEIKAEVSGTVTKMLPKDGQLVQKGDALLRVQPV